MIQQKLVIETDPPVSCAQNDFSYTIVYTNLYHQITILTSITVTKSKMKYSAKRVSSYCNQHDHKKNITKDP